MAVGSSSRMYKVRFRHTCCPPSVSRPSDFSKYDFFFDREQQWVSAKFGLNFVDETEDVVSESINPRTGPHTATPPRSSEASSSTPTDDSTISEAAQLRRRGSGDENLNETDVIGASATHITNVQSWISGRSKELLYIPVPVACDQNEQSNGNPKPADERSTYENLGGQVNIFAGRSMYRNQDGNGVYLPQSSRAPSPHRNQPPWPFNLDQQAHLFRHFIENLSTWFNVNDSKRHFTTVVPRIAATSPMLLFSICAVSARHLESTQGYDACEPMIYHDECLQRLLPALDDPNRIGDDDLLATAIVLRCYEELDVTSVRDDEERHLFGALLFIKAPKTKPASSLRQACFWIHLRQEIYVSFAKQRGLHADLEDPVFHPSVAHADGIAWGNRMAAICAQVLQWAFGGNSSVAGWLELKSAIDLLERTRPENFEAIFYRPEDASVGRWFPEIWFSDDEHVDTSVQYHYAKLVLTIYDPTLPKLGPRATQAARTVEEKVLHRVRTLCGIGLSNKLPPAIHSACVAVIVCCNFFTVREEQKELLNVLRKGARSGWQTEAAIKTLTEEWNWNASDNT